MAWEMVDGSPAKLLDVVVINETQEPPKHSCLESLVLVNKNECVIVVDEFLCGEEMLLVDDQEEGDDDEELEGRQDGDEVEDKFTPWEY